MYRIKGWFPIDGAMNGSSFSIVLTPKWKDAVSKSKFTQESINELLEEFAILILKNHGRNIPDPKEAAYYIRVSWGEWGPEHITVPGNACGLDIDTCFVCCEENEVALTPHNLDTLSQASMILTVFLKIAEILESEDWLRKHKQTLIT